VIKLIQALQHYFDTVDLAKDVPSPEHLHHTWQAAVWDVIQLLWGYERLRKSRRLSQAARTHIPSLHAKTLRNYERFLVHVRESLTPEDYAEMAQDLLPSRHQYVLEAAMVRAFDRYGPPLKRGAFSTTAMYDAVAAILLHFAIEHRQRHTVVSRLTKTRQRARKSP
jgi:hypothetical protein